MKAWHPLVLIALMAGCDSASETDGKPKKEAKKSYEPQFRKDGWLVFLNADQRDTLASIDIEVVQQPDELQFGMMYRMSVPENTGMLFFMPREELQSFWMRNTYVSLDILYINADKRIVSIVEKAKPLSDESLPSKGPALYVLEVAGGYCAQHKIEAGHYVQFAHNRTTAALR
ncbi:DUF192 domain-containing protein [bacterium]|nr:DUF192 domain-containing protein [bacterium]